MNNVKIFCPACGTEQRPNQSEVSKCPSEMRTIAKFAIKCHCGCDCTIRMYNLDIPSEGA